MSADHHISMEDWARLSALLDDALTLPVDRRRDWLDRLPPDQSDLKPALRDLLARAAVDTGDFMRAPVRLRGTGDGMPDGAMVAQPGLLIGPYRLLREIGAGGMGAVWLAERADGVLKRRVALKLPRLNWDTPGLAKRMERERDILAGLEHPNIARLYDAGVDAQGRPYLALEYVEGRPLDVYCNECALGVRDRIGLFLQVARAVAHAHARLVVHRDLKPSNILVTVDGSIRLLDFGVAKLIEGDVGKESANETHLTRVAGRALTPDYASPEQIRGEVITVAVDVYSLAVVLYELLAGQRPYRLKTASAVELEDAIARLEIPFASTVAIDKACARQLRGDLDTILARALKKQPAERYPTVDAFAADLERHLAGVPVLARPDSVVYRVSRFVRRNKLSVGVATLIALALLGGAIPVAAVMIALALGAGVALWQAGIARRQASRAAEEARQAQRERDRAVALSERHEAAVDFIQIMLTEAVRVDEKVTLNELLARSEALALTSIGNQPEQQGAVLDLLSSFYISLGDYAKAEPLLRHAIEVLRPSGDVSLRAQVECNHAAASAFAEIGSVETAKQTIEGWLARDDVEPHTAALCQQYLAQIARNHNDAKGALDNVMRAQARLRASPRRFAALEASIAGDLAYAYFLNGRNDDADRQYAEALQLHRDIGREESPNAVAILNNWSLVCFGAGDIKRGLALNEEVLRIVAKRAADGTAPSYAVSNHAYALFMIGRYEEALHEAERAWSIADRAGARIAKLNVRVIKAMTCIELGDLGAAESILADVAASAQEWPDDNSAVLSYHQCRANLALQRGRFDEAGETLEPVVQLFEHRGMRIAKLLNALRLRAEIRWRQGDLGAAIGDARRALAIAMELQGRNPHSSFTGQCHLLLARLAHETGDLEAADNALQHAIAHLSNALGNDHPETKRARRLAASPPSVETGPDPSG
jgi:serine/threonine-protein kinase